jgi:hypothetical protein
MVPGRLYTFNGKKGTLGELETDVILFATAARDSDNENFSIIELHGRDQGRKWADRTAEEFDEELLSFYDFTPFTDSLTISSK